MVNQGDLLHGDANGVTNIPIEIASEVADIGRRVFSRRGNGDELRQIARRKISAHATTSCGKNFSRSSRR